MTTDSIILCLSANQTATNFLRLSIDATTRVLFADEVHVSFFNDTLRIEDGRGLEWKSNAKEGNDDRGRPFAVRADLRKLGVRIIHEFFNSTGVRFRYVERDGIAGYEADMSHTLRSTANKAEPADRYEGQSLPWIMADLRERIAVATEAGLSDFHFNDDGQLVAVGKTEY